jgi:hypothetical protein
MFPCLSDFMFDSAILLPLTIRVHPDILSISQAISQSTNTEGRTKLGCHMLTLRPYQPLPSMAASNSFKSTHLWRNSPASVDSSFPLFFTSARSLSSSLFSPGSFPGIRRNGKSVPTTHVITMQSPARSDDALDPR